jgi:hypothetical protein
MKREKNFCGCWGCPSGIEVQRFRGSEVLGSAQQLAAEAVILIEKETPACGVSFETSGFRGLN